MHISLGGLFIVGENGGSSILILRNYGGFDVIPFKNIPISHFKRLCSRHIHKEIEISYCVFGFNEIICETGLKPNSDTQNCNIISEEHFEAI